MKKRRVRLPSFVVVLGLRRAMAGGLDVKTPSVSSETSPRHRNSRPTALRTLLATAICFLCVVFVDLSLAATTFYVSTTGSDSAACTQTAPCKTLARAYQVAASADLVEVAAGRYADPNLNNLTGKSVTFR